MDMGAHSALDFTREEAVTPDPAVALPAQPVSPHFVSPAAGTQPVSRGRGFPLAMAASGDRLRLVSYACGRNGQRRLADQGLTVGVAVTVVSNDVSGPMIVAVRGTRIGLGKGLAHKVMMMEAEEGQ